MVSYCIGMLLILTWIGIITHYDAFIGRLVQAGCQHTGLLICVARLAFPEMMIEIEATAVA